MVILDALLTTVLFLVTLGLLVLIHELGHFVAARLANVRVLEFGVGFPPRAKVLRRGGETLYTLNWLPIGGFVKLEGEDGDAASDPRAFSAQPLLVRLLILVAGVAMNVVLAFLLLAGIALLAEPAGGIVAGKVQPGSPAQAAGLQDGDTVISLNGKRYSAFDPVELLDELRASAGQTITIGLARAAGGTGEVSVSLRSPADVAAGKGALGIEQLSARVVDGTVAHPPAEAVALGIARTGDALRLVVDGIGQLAGAIISRPTEAPPASGPIGIADQLRVVFQELGLVGTLYFAALLSANLAVFNILPIPPLDGGRMLMMVLKSIFGSRVSLRFERLTYLVGFVFLFAFLIWVTGFDIVRQLGG